MSPIATLSGQAKTGTYPGRSTALTWEAPPAILSAKLSNTGFAAKLALLSRREMTKGNGGI